MGKMVDEYPRLKLMKYSIIIQNISTFISAGLFWLLLDRAEAMNDAHIWVLFVVTLLFGSVAMLSASVSTIAIEKDWVIIGAKSSNSSYPLTILNSNMKRIDLICKLLAPVFVGIYTSHNDSNNPNNPNNLCIITCTRHP